jgi:sec-independent protein translocase protein TatC
MKNLEKFLPYIEALQKLIFRGTVLFVIVFISGFLSAASILKYILKFVDIDQVVIATTSPFQFTDLAMNIGFVLATIISSLYLIFGFYIFVAPALGKTEKRFLLKSVPLTISLFVIGFSYGFYIMYYAMHLLAKLNTDLGIQNIWDVGNLISQIVLTSIMLGLIFEIPIILSLFIKLGLLTNQFLKDRRRIAYFLIFCLVSLLPPTDGLSLLVMSLPLVLLYELTIVFNIISNKKQICLD